MVSLAWGDSRTNKLLPMQVDGEPWLQPRCMVSVPVLEERDFVLLPPEDADLI